MQPNPEKKKKQVPDCSHSDNHFLKVISLRPTSSSQRSDRLWLHSTELVFMVLECCRLSFLNSQVMLVVCKSSEPARAFPRLRDAVRGRILRLSLLLPAAEGNPASKTELPFCCANSPWACGKAWLITSLGKSKRKTYWDACSGHGMRPHLECTQQPKTLKSRSRNSDVGWFQGLVIHHLTICYSFL